MKWYGSAPGASMHMHEDPVIIGALERLFEGNLQCMKSVPVALGNDLPDITGYIHHLGRVTVAIETGTYLGTGSTKFIAEAFQRTWPPKVFYTIEVDHNAAMQARVNLARFPFVCPLWGSSVDIEQAAEWLENDSVLQTPYAYPDIWIDHIDEANSAKHYAAEMRGSSAMAGHSDWAGEDLLRKLLDQHIHSQPLVILDSAGGIGWLEFQIMLETLAGHRYFVLLDDVQHVKHFRSLDYIKGSDEFVILAESGKAALAVHL